MNNKDTKLGISGISNELLSNEIIAVRATFQKDFNVVSVSPTQIQIKRQFANLNALQGCVMIYDLVEVAQEFMSTVASKQPQVASDSERQSTSNISCSRYLNDFEELRRLGRGGFGRVALCKNKLDGRQYAVKKIPLKDTSEPLNDRDLREVVTLSGLQHQHVVRYYQAWVEARDAGDAASSSGTASSSDVAEPSTASGSMDLSLADAAGHLYIQMEYCPRNVDKKLACHLFRQIVDGVAYIHGQGIIHQDLTPKNILLDARNDIKIGDFGLAKFMKVEEDSPAESGVSVTSDIGTHFYTAPEIQQCLPNINEKADIYSLGIVFLELWHPFSTGSKRLVVLTKIKNERELPPDWAAEFPEQASLLSIMTSSSPSDRPSASELLQSEFISNHQEPTQKLQNLDHQIILFKVKKLSENAVLPTRGSSHAAGYNLSSAIETKVPARGQQLVPTDLSIAVPEGTYARVVPRSGLAWKHSIDVGVGVIEPNYRGPVAVILFNHSDVDFEVKAGDWIAQLFIEKIVTSESIEVDDLDDICT